MVTLGRTLYQYAFISRYKDSDLWHPQTHYSCLLLLENPNFSCLLNIPTYHSEVKLLLWVLYYHIRPPPNSSPRGTGTLSSVCRWVPGWPPQHLSPESVETTWGTRTCTLTCWWWGVLADALAEMESEELRCTIRIFSTVQLKQGKENYLRQRRTLYNEMIGSFRSHINPGCVCPKQAAKYVKQKLVELKKGMDKSIVTSGDFSIPLLTIDRTSRGVGNQGYRSH